MRNVFRPETNPRDFLARAVQDGYSMEERFVEPKLCTGISYELAENGFLEDLVELESTDEFRVRGMARTALFHRRLNSEIGRVTGEATRNHLPFFSVRVFEPGEYSTTVHRNHPSIGPWAVGTTLSGRAPFNVYRQDQLPQDQVQPLKGDGTDPEPFDTMQTRPGSGWVLYTENDLVPHSGGIVHSKHQRELLILYGVEWYDYFSIND